MYTHIYVYMHRSLSLMTLVYLYIYIYIYARRHEGPPRVLQRRRPFLPGGLRERARAEEPTLCIASTSIINTNYIIRIIISYFRIIVTIIIIIDIIVSIIIIIIIIIIISSIIVIVCLFGIERALRSPLFASPRPAALNTGPKRADRQDLPSMWNVAEPIR